MKTRIKLVFIHIFYYGVLSLSTLYFVDKFFNHYVAMYVAR